MKAKSGKREGKEGAEGIEGVESEKRKTSNVRCKQIENG